LAAKVNAYIEMILVHIYKPATNHRRELSSSAKWVPPPEGTVLVNVDAAIFSASKQMGAGIVARDHTGNCIAACGERSDNVVTPELAEALAVRKAALFALDEGFSKIIIASDYLSVIQRIKSSVTEHYPYGIVIEDIKAISRRFTSCGFRHVLCVLNVAAHRLARECFSLVSTV
jgi:hypothetical protein